jgi:hypothetical protein
MHTILTAARPVIKMTWLDAYGEQPHSQIRRAGVQGPMIIAAYTEVKTGQLAIRLGRVASQMAVKRVELPLSQSGRTAGDAAIQSFTAIVGTEGLPAELAQSPELGA